MHKSTRTLLLLSLTFFMPLLLSPAVGAEHNASAKIGAGKTVQIKIFNPKGKQCFFQSYLDGTFLQNEQGLGSGFEPIQVNGVDHLVVTHDLDNDGTEELIFRTNREVASGIWVYTWEANLKKYALYLAYNKENLFFVPKDSTVSFNPSKKTLTANSSKARMLFTWKKQFFAPQKMIKK